MTNISKIFLTKLILILCFNLSLKDIIPFNNLATNLVEVPVLDLNFYMMSRSSADAEILKSIRENVTYLNEEFENKIKFEVKHFFVDEGHALLPDLHKEYFGVEALTVDSLVKNIEDKGSINVYIFDSYVIEELNAELMGFTPIFKSSHKGYEQTSPTFDRIFLAYTALNKKTTLVHEMGHFLGLDHPWEMTDINQDLMGLNSTASIEENHMAYGSKVEGFTTEQLDRMQHFALQFRGYLIDRSEYYFKNTIASNL